MNLYLRFILLILKRLVITKPIEALDPCRTRFRVNIMDLDLNMHMNNGRYLSVMDLGRIDLLLKGKVFWSVFRQGYYPVLTSQSIRYKKSLGLFEAFDLITQIEAWDEKDIYMSQKFVRDRVVCAEGFIKARFLQRGRKGSVPTRELFDVFGMEYAEGAQTKLSQMQREIEAQLVVERE